MDYFAHHSIFFTLSLIISPFWTLLLFSNTHMTIMGWIASFFFSNEAIIYCAVVKGYHQSNPWAVCMFIALYLFQKTLHQIKYRLLVRTLRVIFHRNAEPFYLIDTIISTILRSCFSTSVIVEFINFAVRNMKNIVGPHASNSALRGVFSRWNMHRSGNGVSSQSAETTNEAVMTNRAVTRLFRELLQNVDGRGNNGDEANENDSSNERNEDFNIGRFGRVSGGAGAGNILGGQDDGRDLGDNFYALGAQRSARVIIDLCAMFASLMRELMISKERLRVYEDASRIPELNQTQLQALRSEITDILEPIDDRLEQIKQENRNDMDGNVSLQCCYCLDAAPTISFSPCQHQSLCQPCFEALLQKRDDGDTEVMKNCFICRSSIMTWHVQKESNVMNRISPMDYHSHGTFHTANAMVKLYEYVKQNPRATERLQKPQVFHTLIHDVQ